MKRIKFIKHHDRRICFINFSDAEAKEVIKIIGVARKLIASQEPKSVLTLTDVTNMHYDKTMLMALKQYTTHNKPFVKTGAIVGISGPLMKMIYSAVLAFSKRKNLKIFDSVEKAKDWLATR